MRGNPFSHSIGSPIQAVLLGLLHRQHLAPARQQGRQLLGRCIGDHPQGRSDDLCKARQHRRSERVRLGQLARRLGKVPHLSRIGNHDRQPRRDERPDEWQFETVSFPVKETLL